MKIKVLEYQRYKGSKVRVKSHKKGKDGIWRKNPKYEFHKLQKDRVIQYPLVYKKEWIEESKEKNVRKEIKM